MRNLVAPLFLQWGVPELPSQMNSPGREFDAMVTRVDDSAVCPDLRSAIED
jgi:hypothetical protein